VTYSVPHLLFGAAVVGTAALVKSTVGFGFPFIAIPVLAAAFGPRFAIPVVVPATLVGNVILVSTTAWRGRAHGRLAAPGNSDTLIRGWSRRIGSWRSRSRPGRAGAQHRQRRQRKRM